MPGTNESFVGTSDDRGVTAPNFAAGVEAPNFAAGIEAPNFAAGIEAPNFAAGVEARTEPVPATGREPSAAEIEDLLRSKFPPVSTVG